MRHQNDPGTFDLMTGRLLLGYARVSTDKDKGQGVQTGQPRVRR